MAKDGTNRGGVRVGAGRKKKPLEEKILEGQAIEKVNLSILNSSDEMPPPKEYLSSVQKNGEKLCATEIYFEMWNWLKARGCESLIDTQLLEQYSVCMARWKQCEEAISKSGLKGRHPTTGGEMASVYVRMSQDYLKLSAQLRYQIYSTVKENFSFASLSQDSSNDNMEILLQMNKEIQKL